MPSTGKSACNLRFLRIGFCLVLDLCNTALNLFSSPARITFSPVGKRRLGQQDSRQFQVLRAHPHLNNVLLHRLPEVSRPPVIRALTVPTAAYMAQQRPEPHSARHADIFSILGNWAFLTARLRVFLGWRQSRNRRSG